MTRMIDLHVHTTASDGTFTPSDVVLLAKKAGLAAMAITDHDTVDGIEEAVNKALKKHEPIKPQPAPEIKDSPRSDANATLSCVSYDDITKAIENIVSNILNNANSVTDTSNNTNTTSTSLSDSVVEYKKTNNSANRIPNSCNCFNFWKLLHNRYCNGCNSFYGSL